MDIYQRIEPLVTEHLSVEEWPDTAALIKEFRAVKERGWLTKADLVKVCYWKSPRAIHYINSNRPATIKEITALALKSRNETVKITELTKLNGVSIPMASSLLTLVNPQRYGVMDIRVWELLYGHGIVTTNAKASGFKYEEWYQLLDVLRYFSKKLDVTARDVERTLFLIHKKQQEGILYWRQKKNK